MSDQAPGPPERRSQRDRMLAGELYLADDPQLAADNLRALRLTREFNASDPADGQARLALLRELLGSLGEGHRDPPAPVLRLRLPDPHRGAESGWAAG